MNTESKTGQKGDGNKEGEGPETESTGTKAQRGSITKGSDSTPKAEKDKRNDSPGRPSSGHE
ncbi:MAG: hypothetical protein H0W43_14590 [Chthoniobacterales bacterium]|jgi:hypothetical protein|nr:hypothetical protein [Chthoniobacterales bacterium]